MGKNVYSGRKAAGEAGAHGVRRHRLLLYGYAFPELERKWLVLILAAGWAAGELAAWWWVRRRRAAKKPSGKRRTAA